MPTTNPRPLIAFFAQMAPYPTPLNGTQLRIDRLVGGLLEQFDIAFVCQTPVDAEVLRSQWPLGPRLRRVITAPAPTGPIPEDGYWGSVGSCISATARTMLPGRRPRVFDWSWSPQLIEAARAMFRELSVEAVWASRTWMAEMALEAGAPRIIVDVDDFQGKLRLEELGRTPHYARKPLHWVQLHHLKRYERRLLDRFTAIAAVKPEDLSLVDRVDATRVHLVPNGVDIPASIHRDHVCPAELLFVGDLSYEPNVEALIDLATHILPLVRKAVPEARLTVAGRKPLSTELRDVLSRPEITVHESPVSLVEFYSRATLFVAPLSIGGGTSIKVLESLAYGLPTVASSVAARGLGLRSGEHLVITDSPEALAEACIELLNNREQARALGLRGREEVSRRFSWNAVGAAARAAVHQLLPEPATAA